MENQKTDTQVQVANSPSRKLNSETSSARVEVAPSVNFFEKTMSHVSWFDFFWVFAIAVILTLIARKLGEAFSATPFRRWLPFTYAVIWIFSFVLFAYLYVEGLPQIVLLTLLVVSAIMFVLFFLEEIRGVVAGIILSFDRSIQIGNAIKVGSVEGKVIAFRMRFVRVKASDGVVYDIPNTQFQKEIISNFSDHGEHSRCTIRLPLSDKIRPDDAIHAARMACILSPYASIYLKPEILLSERNSDVDRLQLNIHAFAFDQNVRETYRSDILTRLEKTLFEEEVVNRPKPQLIIADKSDS